MKYLQEVLITVAILILGSTCVFVCYQMSVAAHHNNFDVVVQLHELEQAIIQNKQAIQDIRTLLLQEKQTVTVQPSSSSRRHAPKVADFRASNFKATLIQATLDEDDSFFIHEQAPEIEQFQVKEAPNPFEQLQTPDEYWRKLKQVANTRESLQINPSLRKTFLETGASLIQRYEEAISNHGLDSEAVQLIEPMVKEEGVVAIESFYTTKKKLAVYVSQAKQFCRELNNMIGETPKIVLPSRSTYLPVATGDTTQKKYSHLRIDSLIEFAQDGNILAKIHFMYRGEQGGMPHITQVSDLINLRTMSSTSGEYIYPIEFQREIQDYIYQQRRFQNLIWNKQPTAEELQLLLRYLGR